MPEPAIARVRRGRGDASGLRGHAVKFYDIACAALPDGVLCHVQPAIERRWKGVRLYMPARRKLKADAAPRNAAEQFACDLRAAVLDAGGSPAQADEILTALSGGYFWV